MTGLSRDVMEAEIARLRNEVEAAARKLQDVEGTNRVLRAEVERLTTQVQDFIGVHPVDALATLREERDEALARIKTLEATLNDIPCAGPSDCEARVLIQAAEEYLRRQWVKGR